MDNLVLKPEEFCRYFYEVFQRQFNLPLLSYGWQARNRLAPKRERYELEYNGADLHLSIEHGSRKLYRVSVNFSGKTFVARAKHCYEGVGNMGNQMNAHWLIEPQTVDLMKLRLIM